MWSVNRRPRWRIAIQIGLRRIDYTVWCLAPDRKKIDTSPKPGYWQGSETFAAAPAVRLTQPCASQDDLIAALARLDVWSAQAMAATPVTVEMSVVVADAWLPQAVVPWSDDMLDSASAEASLRAHLTWLGYDLSPTDIVCCDMRRAGAPRLVLVWPGPLMAAVQACAIRHGAQLETMAPWGLAVWYGLRAQARPHVPTLALSGDGWLHILVADGQGHVSQVITRRTAGQGNALLEVVWHQACLRDSTLSIESPGVMVDVAQAMPRPQSQGLAVAAEEGASSAGISAGMQASSFLPWAPAHNDEFSSVVGSSCPPLQLPHYFDAAHGSHFTSPRLWSRAGWCAISCVALLLLAFAVDTSTQIHQLYTLRTQITQAHTQAMQRQLAASSRVPDREHAARQAAMTHAIHELNRPDLDLLAAVRPPPDLRVSVLGITLQPTSAETGRSSDPSAAVPQRMGAMRLHIDAEAASGDDMARYAAYVNEKRRNPADARTIFSAVILQRHRLTDQDSESASLVSRPALQSRPPVAWRFSLEARWQP